MALPSNGNYNMQSEDADSSNKVYYLVNNNGKITFNTSNPALVSLQAVSGSNTQFTLAIGRQYLGIDGNGNAVLSDSATPFTLAEAGTDSGTTSYTVAGSWTEGKSDKNGDLSIPSSGTVNSTALDFSAPPSGGPTKASKKQKWIFKTIQSPEDSLVK